MLSISIESSCNPEFNYINVMSVNTSRVGWNRLSTASLEDEDWIRDMNSTACNRSHGNSCLFVEITMAVVVVVIVVMVVVVAVIVVMVVVVMVLLLSH